MSRADTDPRETLGSMMDGSLPLPRRTRLIREISSDLDGVTAVLVARGVPMGEARARARETVLPDASTLAEIEGLSLPVYRRLTLGADPARVRQLERLALVLATLSILVMEASALVGAGLLDDPSPFLWPVLLLGASTMTALLAKAFQLWIKGHHRRPRRGLGLVGVLAGLTFVTALGGVMVDFIALASVMEGVPPDGHELVAGWVVRTATLLSTGIILALAGGLGRFVLSAWITHVEESHRRALHTVSTPIFMESSS